MLKTLTPRIKNVKQRAFMKNENVKKFNTRRCWQINTIIQTNENILQ